MPVFNKYGVEMTVKEKPVSPDEVHLGYLKILASYHTVCGDRSVGKALEWAATRIETLQKHIAQHEGCRYCNSRKRMEILGDVSLPNVVPLHGRGE